MIFVAIPSLIQTVTKLSIFLEIFNSKIFYWILERGAIFSIFELKIILFTPTLDTKRNLRECLILAYRRDFDSMTEIFFWFKHNFGISCYVHVLAHVHWAFRDRKVLTFLQGYLRKWLPHQETPHGQRDNHPDCRHHQGHRGQVHTQLEHHELIILTPQGYGKWLRIRITSSLEHWRTENECPNFEFEWNNCIQS